LLEQSKSYSFSEAAFLKGLIINLQRFSLQDGPGIRTTVFFKGCPLRCCWCSNPESQDFFPQIAHKDYLCKKCGKCLLVCHQNAISLSEAGVKIKREQCDNCGTCVPACKEGALILYGQHMSAEEIIAEVLRDTSYYRTSGGGITAGGGEPCLQSEFLSHLFKQCQKKGLHATLDTCGCVSRDSFREILEHTDLVLYDLKHMDSEKHKRFTGLGNEQLLQNIEMVDTMNIPFRLRLPLIPTINDDEKNIRATAEFAAHWRNIQGLDLLPYHRLGMTKYNMLDRRYELDGLQPPKDIDIKRAKEIIASYDLACEIGG
jgi:pyruvate formate lyase activating enzyme